MADWESCVAVYCGASPGKKPIYEQAAVGKYDCMVNLWCDHEKITPICIYSCFPSSYHKSLVKQKTTCTARAQLERNLYTPAAGYIDPKFASFDPLQKSDFLCHLILKYCSSSPYICRAGSLPCIKTNQGCIWRE